MANAISAGVGYSKNSGLFTKGPSVETQIGAKVYTKGSERDIGKGNVGYGVSATAVEAGYKGKNVNASVKMATGEANLKAGKGTIKVGGEATIVKYEGSVSIPIPGGGKVSVGGSVGLGTVGASLEVSKTKYKPYVGWGVGAGFSIDLKAK